MKVAIIEMMEAKIQMMIMQIEKIMDVHPKCDVMMKVARD